MQQISSAPPLSGIRVLDLGRYQAAPRCALTFARLGADVIHVEPPEGEESRRGGPLVRGQSAYWVQYNSGKRSLGLNLYTDEGKEVLRELVTSSDVFIQNFRPGTIDVMGFGYEALRALNPRIVMVNISAYGQAGPYRERVGFEQVGQAISGHMAMTGYEGMPPLRTYFNIIDRITGLHATVAALAALWESRISGQGQSIDVCLADTGYSLMEIAITHYLGTGQVARRTGNGEGPLSNTYQCQDGWAYLINAGGGDMWPRVAEALSHPEWLEDPRFATREARTRNQSLLVDDVTRWFASRTVKEAVDTISAHSVPIAPVNTVEQAAADPHPWERDVLVEAPDPIAGTIHVSGNLFHFSRSDIAVGPAPLPGEHTDEILTGLLHMAPERIAHLRQQKVI